jgi:hypothetical protein
VTLVAVVSLKGAPGTTTLAVALGAVWPGPVAPVVVELDPSGADLPARFALEPAPGLTTYAVAARQRGQAVGFDDHLQRLPGGLAVCCGLPWPAAARALANEVAAWIPAWRRGADPVVVDGGRLKPDCPAQTSLLGAADTVVLVSSGERGHLALVAEALSQGSLPEGRLVVVVREGRGARTETRGLRCPVLDLPEDPRAAVLLRGGAGSPRRFGGSAFLRVARQLGKELADRPVALGPAAARERSLALTEREVSV